MYRRWMVLGLFVLLFQADMGETHLVGDIDGDGKVGVEEAVFALKVAGGIYPDIPSTCVLIGKDTWAVDQPYDACNVVLHDGDFYIAVIDHQSTLENSPPNPDFWVVLPLSDLAAAQAQIDTLTINLNNQQGQIDNLTRAQTDFAAAQAGVADRTADLATAQAALDAAIASGTATPEEIAALEADVATAQTALASAQGNLATAQANVTVTHGDLDAALQLPANEPAGLLACSTCHGTSTAAAGWLASKHAMNSSHTINSCATCHNPSGAMNKMASAFGVNPTGTVVGCEDCHGAGSNHVNAPYGNLVAETAPATAVCGQCHDGAGAEAHLTHHPINLQITSRYQSSKHADSEHGGGLCSACHSHAGGVRNIETGRATRVIGVTGELGLIDKYTPDTAAEVWTVEDQWGSMQCATCHDPHTLELRTEDTLAMVTGDHDDDPDTEDTAQEMVVYSAQFNLCTTCHQIDLDYTPGGHGDAGLLLDYTLTAESYSAANVLDADTGTFNVETSFTLLNADGVTTTDRTVYDTQVFYHDNTPHGGRNFSDTHFAGTVVGRIAAVVETEPDYLEGVIDVEVVGYNINAADPSACTICHDPHTVNKVQGDSLEAAVDHAEGLGEFHTNYLGSAMGHGCRPCHDGGVSFMTWVQGGSTPSGSATGVIGCRTCHNLEQPADGDPTEVRGWPEGHAFAFASGTAVDVADLGVNQICFECHKGRNASITAAAYEALADPAAGTQLGSSFEYLHYAPVFATLFGSDSGMIPAYPGKTYAGRFVHPVEVAGVTEFGCVDCHDVHNTNEHHAATNKMTKAGSACVGCHGAAAFVDAAVLAARTVAYGERLMETLVAALRAADGQVGLNEGCQTLITSLKGAYPNADYASAEEELAAYIGGRNKYFPNKKTTMAAAMWKVFNYEDGSPHGVTHGHGGSWAHNSKYARQAQYDAIQDMGGDLTGLTRP